MMLSTTGRSNARSEGPVIALRIAECVVQFGCCSGICTREMAEPPAWVAFELNLAGSGGGKVGG